MVREITGLRGTAVKAVFALRRRWYTARYPGLVVGKGVMFIGSLRLQRGTRLVLGDRVRVRKNVRVYGGGSVTVGADTLLNGCWIIAAESVTIGARCLVSDAGITDNDFHNLPPRQRHDPPSARSRAPVVIENNVWVGAHALVLKGSHIGHDSAVGTGAVVRAQVPPRVVVSGNPAVVVKQFRDED